MSFFFKELDVNIGQDCSIALSSNAGHRFTAEELGHLTDFDADFEDTEETAQCITNGGIPLFETIPQGVAGKFVFLRMNGKLSQMLVDQQTAYYQNGRRLRWTISFQVRNPDSSVDVYTIYSCKISKGSLGKFKGNKFVEQGFNFRGGYVRISRA